MRIRIVALGDSTTAGTPGWKLPLEAPPEGSGDETSQYPYWLMQARQSWDVLNRGVNGERSDQVHTRFRRDVIDAQPVAVVIIAGVNDVYQGRPAESVIEQLQAMYQRAHRSGIKVVAGSIVPYNTATPDQNGRMHEVNDWIRAYARRTGIGFADTRAAVAAPDNPDLLFETLDGLHPSPAGYRRMAEAIDLALAGTLNPVILDT